MGQCGCGDYVGGYRIPGPVGITYILSFYPGCKYCSTGPGWVLYRFDEEDAKFWGAAEEPKAPFREFDGAFPIVVIEPEHLAVAIREDFADLPGAREFAEDIHDTLLKASRRSVAEWEKKATEGR